MEYPNISDSGTVRVDHLRLAALIHSTDLAAARRQIAEHVAHVLIGADDFDVHDRLEDDRLRACFAASLNAIDPAILNAISLESTSWYEPYISSTFTSTIG